MSSVSREHIETALKQYIDPYLDQDLLSAKCIKDIAVDGGKVKITVVLGFPAKGYEEILNKAITDIVGKVDGVESVQVDISSKIEPHTAQKGVKPIPGVKNIIAVASGKGGARCAVNVDWLSHRRRHADDLAWSHGNPGTGTVA